MRWNRGGHLDSNCRVRIAYLRAERMLLYTHLPTRGSSSSNLDATQLANGQQGGAGSETAPHPQGEKRLRPGQVLALAQADELLFNEAGNEVVVVKYPAD